MLEVSNGQGSDLPRPRVRSLTVLYIPLVLIGTPFTYIHDLKFYSVFLYKIFKSMAF